MAYTSTAAARLTVLGASGQALLQDASSSLLLSDGTLLDLSRDGQPTGNVTINPVSDPALGAGLRTRAVFSVARLQGNVTVELTVFEQGPYLTYRLILPWNGQGVQGFGYAQGALFPDYAANPVDFVADDDAVQLGRIQDRPVERQVAQGKPLLLRGSDGEGLLMAVIDPTDLPSTFSASRVAGESSFRWQQRWDPTRNPYGAQLPRLLVQAVDPGDLGDAFSTYRHLLNQMYPPAPLPAWFRQQWISWYLYGTEIDEQKLRSQVDYIAAELNDLGPWSILVDAGWYRAEGRPDADWRAVDGDKFPSGLRSFVDYAHDKGIKVVLYFSASYVDDLANQGNWLGLKGIVDKHPDWLVPIRSGDAWRAYYYDYSSPGFQAYLRAVLRDYFVSYGVDGIKVDGLMDTRLAVKRGIRQGLYSPSTAPAVPVTSVYAFIYREAAALRPDVYLEAGWQMPAYSAPNFTVARQSDDTPDFDSPYPAPGLKGHVDYAIAQWLMLGQRPHLGNFWGDPNSNSVGLEWLEAGLALNAPVVLGFDLPSMSQQALSDYRARLSQLRPFLGEVHLPGGLTPDSFSTTARGTTFLALINRSDEPKTIRAALADHGVQPDARFAAYDVEGGSTLSATGAITATVRPRSLRLFVLRSQPGVLWSNSGFELSAWSGDLWLSLSGPTDLPGYAYVAAPPPSAVLMNGDPLPDDSWSYDAIAGVLRVDYVHGEDGPTVIEVRTGGSG